jgi:hypothetical protein
LIRPRLPFVAFKQLLGEYKSGYLIFWRIYQSEH